MIIRIGAILGSAILVAAALAFHGPIRAAEAPGDALAATGAAVYDRQCATCHGGDLTGGDHGPNLKGEGFWAHWQGQPARRLYSRILSTMPANEPGSLSETESLALVALIARANGQPLNGNVSTPADLDAQTLAP